MKKARAIMIQGTGSGVGKSVITCALCRIFLQDGFSVAPFKAQNMALNSFVTDDGKEIGRAQATQALSCKIRPSVHINPILIKPTSHTLAQIIVHGKPVKNMSVYQYKRYKKTVFNRVRASYEKLAGEHDLIVIEGAGSPAEVNLKSHDLVNMRVAKLASAPVILVGDIDKGGVFAWLIGTLELLTAEERKMVKGFIINKFRGDKRLLMPGIKFLENYTGIKVLGVLPYYQHIKLPEEDSLPMDSKKGRLHSKNRINILVIYLPHMSNFDDFDALEKERDVSLRYVKDVKDFADPDVMILPGTKNTIEDFRYLKKAGLAHKIETIFRSKPKVRLVGICGGYQMLGEAIFDNKNTESKSGNIDGLGILPIVTELYPEKILSQVKARDLSSGIDVSGYEIHHGQTKIKGAARPAFEIATFLGRRVKKQDGARDPDGRCWGTYIHGIFDSDVFRRDFLNLIRKDKGWPLLQKGISHDPDKEIDKISGLVRENIDMDLLYNTIFKKQ
ncbi:MAG: cobyric acid synthase [Candidatus Omnitrophota bacterium]|nr:cobyric acid synthase [Candidatus Omnitrophota bacterium]